MFSVHDTPCIRCLGPRLETVTVGDTADSRQTCPLHGQLDILDFLYQPADAWNVKAEVINLAPRQLGYPFGCVEINYRLPFETITEYVLLASLLR